MSAIVLTVILAASLGFQSARAADGWREDADVVAARAATGDAVVPLYQIAIKKHPDVAQLHAELASILFDAKRYTEAAAEYTRAGELGWKPEIVHVRIGKALDRDHKYKEAEAEYRKALTATPESLAAQFGLAAVLFNQDKSADAIPLLEKLAPRKDEWGQFSQEYLAQAYFDVKNYEKSLALAKELVARSPDDPTFSWLLARNLYKTRKFAEALVLFRQQIAKDPKRAEAARYYAAVCLENLGRFREAESEYTAASFQDTEFGREARQAARRLAGNPFRFVLDYQGGYDTGIILNDANGTPTKKKDSFDQTFLDIQGRIAHEKGFDLWIGAEHYSILYPRFSQNDYISHAGKLIADIPEIGPFRRLLIQYSLRYSELDAAAYRYEHRLDAGALYTHSIHQLYYGISVAVNKFFHDSENLSGPDGAVFADYTLTLPKWDHLFRVHTDVTYRWSEDPASERLTERVRMLYRSHLASVIYANIAGTYRRDDFPRSETSFINHRTDTRWTGELLFDAQVRKHLYVNWGYTYESQNSTRADQRYTRHQGSAGFTITF